MKTSKTIGIAIAAAFVGSIVTHTLANGVACHGSVTHANVVDAKVNLRVPENCRTRYAAAPEHRAVVV